MVTYLQIYADFTEKIYKLGPPGGIFDETVVLNLLPDRSEGARKAIVHRAVQSGEILRLKPGLYCLYEIYRKTHPHPFSLAGVLHFPSHVSLESALNYHGLIPEAAYEVAGVTSRRTRHFKTPLGNFSFQRVPIRELVSGRLESTKIHGPSSRRR